ESNFTCIHIFAGYLTFCHPSDAPKSVRLPTFRPVKISPKNYHPSSVLKQIQNHTFHPLCSFGKVFQYCCSCYPRLRFLRKKRRCSMKPTWPTNAALTFSTKTCMASPKKNFA